MKNCPQSHSVLSSCKHIFGYENPSSLILFNSVIARITVLKVCGLYGKDFAFPSALTPSGWRVVLWEASSGICVLMGNLQTCNFISFPEDEKVIRKPETAEQRGRATETCSLYLYEFNNKMGRIIKEERKWAFSFPIAYKNQKTKKKILNTFKFEMTQIPTLIFLQVSPAELSIE